MDEARKKILFLLLFLVEKTGLLSSAEAIKILNPMRLPSVQFVKFWNFLK